MSVEEWLMVCGGTERGGRCVELRVDESVVCMM